ncbi:MULTISPECIES: tetratricopeptide repeat protein [Methanobrevibacter]|uniref:Tetratricopeptide repeat protein n=1 Tax=Methanobrevibacter gottschalkii DSM 11977 TaxID=1122229 RepID=A0A3N5AZB6_9EURY|nr:MULTISPECIES: tetratricopeptide repeat protein [Methanobrevibacter]OEC94294.1 hypothetical protein A9505_08860 [Methanobrevibacter sp. A27]RPF50414.1 tetratricopeptide repeat protein [Methanobrevibacter gottschalkii DSM 11977]
MIEIHDKLGTLDELLVIIDDLLLDERYDYNELLVQKGNILSIQGKDKIAMKCFDKVLQDDSTNLWAYYFKCYVLNKSDDLSNFDKLFSMVKSQSPDEYYIWLLIGVLFSRNDRFDDALYCIDESINRYDGQEDSWLYKGLIFYEMGKYDEALSAIDIALKINPKDSYLYLTKSVILNAMEKYDGAIFYSNKCLELDKNNVLCLYNLSLSLYNQNKFDESLKYCESALKIDPNYCLSLNLYAEILRHKKKV